MGCWVVVGDCLEGVCVENWVVEVFVCVGWEVEEVCVFVYYGVFWEEGWDE